MKQCTQDRLCRSAILRKSCKEALLKSHFGTRSPVNLLHIENTISSEHHWIAASGMLNIIVEFEVISCREPLF